MAGQLPCDICGEEVGITLQTNLANGDVMAVGVSCMLAFYLASALQWSEQVSPEVLEAAAPQVVALAHVPRFWDALHAELARLAADSGGQGAAASSPRGKSTSKRRGAPKQDTTTADAGGDAGTGPAADGAEASAGSGADDAVPF